MLISNSEIQALSINKAPVWIHPFKKLFLHVTIVDLFLVTLAVSLVTNFVKESVI